MTRRHLFMVIILTGLFAMAIRPAVDPDLGWHLRTGQLIAGTHAIPHQDVFSFTKAGAPWVAHEWLTDVLIYGLSRLGGDTALILFFALLITIAFGLLYSRCEARPYAAGLLVLWGAITTIPGWGVRPQILTLLLASVYLLLLDEYVKTGRARLLWWLPVLMILWVNLHAGYAIGIALLLLYAIAELSPATGNRTRLKFLLGAVAACTAVVPLNPNGFKLYAYPFQTLNAPSMMGYIEEWASPDFHRPIYRVLLLFIVFLVVVLARSHRRPDARETVLLLATLAAALTSARHLPFFILVAVPILSRRMPQLSGEQPLLPSRWVLHAAVAALAVFAAALQARSVIQRQPQEERAAFPVAAVHFLKTHSLPTQLYNSYDWGGYLIANAYPNYRVFIDGRADVYGDHFIDQAVRAHEEQPGWEATLQQYGVRTVLVENTAPLATILRESGDWKNVFEDSQAAVFTRLDLTRSLEQK
jgi:hypothetical protein